MVCVVEHGAGAVVTFWGVGPTESAKIADPEDLRQRRGLEDVLGRRTPCVKARVGRRIGRFESAWEVPRIYTAWPV